MNEKVVFGEFNGDKNKIEEIKNKDPKVFVLGSPDIQSINNKFKFICGFIVPEYRFYFAFGSMSQFPEHKDLFVALEKNKNESFQFRKGGRISFEQVSEREYIVKIFGLSVTYGRYNPEGLKHFHDKIKLEFEKLYPGIVFNFDIQEKV